MRDGELEMLMSDKDVTENDRKQIRFLMAWCEFKKRFEKGRVYRGGDVYDAFEAGVEHGRNYSKEVEPK